jgi:UDP-glucose 4-epimerase
VTPKGTCLVTGGCGFIGVNLGARLQADGWRVVALDDLSTGCLATAEAAGYDDVVVADVRDLDALAGAIQGARGVVHLAAQTGVPASVADPRTDLDVNVTGTLNALLASVDAGVERFVFASSNAPLGVSPQPVHEDIPPRPRSPYGASKLAGEGYCSAVNSSYGLATAVLRFANVYGPHSDHKGSVVAQMLRAAFSGEALRVYGDGSQTRDFVYVDDLCDGIARALGTPVGGTFQLGTGVETSVSELVRLLEAQLPDVRVDVRHLAPRPGDVARSVSDIGRARRLLGFEPQIDLASGLSRTTAWFARARVG